MLELEFSLPARLGYLPLESSKSSRKSLAKESLLHRLPPFPRFRRGCLFYYRGGSVFLMSPRGTSDRPFLVNDSGFAFPPTCSGQCKLCRARFPDLASAAEWRRGGKRGGGEETRGTRWGRKEGRIRWEMLRIPLSDSLCKYLSAPNPQKFLKYYVNNWDFS